MKPAIAVIGFGTMGSAIAAKARDVYDFFVFDADAAKLPAADPGITVCTTLPEALRSAETVIIAVKPQDFQQLLSVIKYSVENKLVVSIAAGIRTSFIESVLAASGQRVVRVMPNLALTVGKGMSCISKGAHAGQKDLSFVTGLFKLMGTTLVIKEELMDAATAVSGSGPGFFFEQVAGKSVYEAEIYARGLFQEELAGAARQAGFSAAQAALLARATAEGSVETLKKSGLKADVLRDRVTSKGGTTEAGLKLLRRGAPLAEAVLAARDRAQELAR